MCDAMIDAGGWLAFGGGAFVGFVLTGAAWIARDISRRAQLQRIAGRP